VPFHIESAPAATTGWNGDGHPGVPVTTAEIAAMLPAATRFLVF
jgi:hypothetical protein